MTNQQPRPFASLWGIVVGVAFLVFLFVVARGIFNLLAWLSPLLLIGALLVNYKTVINYGKWIVNQLNSNTLFGILAIIVTIVAYPVVFALLFGKAFLDKKIGKVMGQVQSKKEEEFVEYEELPENFETLELESYEEIKEEFKEKFDGPVIEEDKIETNDYEDLFD